MPERALLDTNVLVYAYDPSDPAKRAMAQSLIRQLVDEDRLIVSVQVLNEFYRASTRAHRPPSLPHEEAAALVRHIIAAASEVVPLTAAVTLRALGGVRDHGMSLWDAVLWASAAEHSIAVIYSEDTPSAP